jgi:hypothetical protein
VITTPGTALIEAPLSPVDRSAILLLNWWKRFVRLSLPRLNGIDPRVLKIRTNHFILALAALHELDPKDELYISRAANASAAFSLKSMLITMLKILKYLQRTYTLPKMFTEVEVAGTRGSPITAAEYVFPLVSGYSQLEFAGELSDPAFSPSSRRALRWTRCIRRRSPHLEN